MNRNDRAITALVMLAHSMIHTYEMVIPLFVVIWLVEFDVISLGLLQFDVTTATIGVIVTIGYGLFGFGALPSGVFVDRIGSRRLITVCLLGMGSAYLLLGLAPSMLVIALALVLWGVSASIYHPAGLSLISKGVEERGSGFAYHGMAGNLGIGVGPLIAAILLLFLEWRSVALILSVPALLATVYANQARFDEAAAVSRTMEADGGSRAESGVESFGEFIEESKQLFVGSFVLVFAIVICSGLYYRGILTFLPELLQGFRGFDPVPITAIVPESVHGVLGIETGGGRVLHPEDYFYSGLLIIGVLGQYIGGRLTDRFPVEYGLAGAFATLSVLAVLFIPVSNIGIQPLIVLGMFLGIFLFVVQPMYQATVAEYTPPGTRGLSYGYTYLGVFGVGSFGGAIAGGILAVAEPFTLFLTLAGFAVIAAVIGFYLGRQR